MTNYAVQEQNQDMVSLLAAYFRLLYNPTHALTDAISMLKMFPGLVGFWPGSVSGGGSTLLTSMVDISGNGLHLARSGGTFFNAAQLQSFISFNGSTGYHSHADAAIFDITGTETHVVTALRGLTLGAWVYFNNTAASTETIMSKWNSTGGNFSYSLIRKTDGLARLRISVDGSASVTVDSSAVIPAAGWRFVVGVFDPSTSLDVWVNGTKTSNTTSIPASIFSSNAAFGIGADPDAPGNFLNGRVSLAFLAQTFVPDQFINAYYQMTAPLFGVSI